MHLIEITSQHESGATVDQGFHATTAGISIHVSAYYLDQQSKPESGHFVWAYRVKISNNSQQTVQLLRRTWDITNAQGHTMHVEGEGGGGSATGIGAGREL